jgi:phosphopantothenoylcysteine decarboxylase/phosphopantothenate--cysteine ligase
MGYAIAESAAGRGARVTLVSGPTYLDPPHGVELVRVHTVGEMHDAVMKRLGEIKLLIAAAAPADFAPDEARQKIKKSEALTLHLTGTVDILAEVGKQKDDIILVGFAAETEQLEDNAKSKLKRKNLDLIVVNDVSPGSDTFGSDTNQVSLISRTGEKIDWPRMSKHEVADEILDYVKSEFLS